jgi:hypothetical protein
MAVSSNILEVNEMNTVSTAECGSGDGLQTEEHIFWNCKLYEDQRTTMLDILCKNSKKVYPKSVIELLRLEEKNLCKAPVT